MSGAHTWGNHRSPGLGPSQSHLIGHQHFFRSSWVPLLSRSTAALPCIPPPPQGTEPFEKIRLFSSVTVLHATCVPSTPKDPGTRLRASLPDHVLLGHRPPP